MYFQEDYTMGLTFDRNRHDASWRETVMKRQKVSSAEIAAFVEGIADQETARRVLSATLLDPKVRQQVEMLRTFDDGFAKEAATGRTGQDADFEARAGRLRGLMMEAVPQVQDEAAALRRQRRALTAILREGRGGALVHVAVGTLNALRNQARETLREAITVGRQGLTLPCLAPATATTAVAPEINIRRQSVTADGVRIEFQQLPGIPGRLRVLVDASGLSSRKSALKQAGEQDISQSRAELSENTPSDGANAARVGYNVAYLTLEDGDRAHPDRHILVVSLNDEGRGYTDYLIGGEGMRAIPAPRTLCSLVGATLSHLEQTDHEDASQDDFDEFEVGTNRGGTF
jgi:hypothetical protein